MKKVEAERYQKTKQQPSPEEISFSESGVSAAQRDDCSIGDEQNDTQVDARTNERSNELTMERTNERPNVRTVNRTPDMPGEQLSENRASNSYVIAVPKDRVKSRHTFGIFEDQKQALDSLQMAARDMQGKKPSLGEMVREALDDYIETRTDELPNVRTNEYSNDRANERSGQGSTDD